MSAALNGRPMERASARQAGAYDEILGELRRRGKGAVIYRDLSSGTLTARKPAKHAAPWSPERMADERKLLDAMEQQVELEVKMAEWEARISDRELLADREKGYRVLAYIVEDPSRMAFVEDVAVHEAGHAYRAWLAGVDIIAVGLKFEENPRRCSGGFTRYRPADDDQDAAAIALAGVAAEREAGIPCARASGADMALVREALGAGKDAQQKVEGLIVSEQQLLRRSWPAIQALARELKVKVNISGEEAGRIIGQALRNRHAA